MMKKFIIILGFILLFGKAVAFQDASKTADTTISKVSLSTNEEALTKALEITGFQERFTIPLAPAEKLVKKVVITDDETPFLNDSINNKELWVVRLDSVDIRTPLAISWGDVQPILRSFDIYLDPKTGKVLKIESVFEGTEWVEPYLPSEIASSILRQTGEVYYGFPDEPPKISFLKALHAAVGCKSPVAKKIVAQLVMHTKIRGEPKPVWCITCFGHPPTYLTAKSRSVSKEFLDKTRCVVDATSGEWMFMTNTPYVGKEAGLKKK